MSTKSAYAAFLRTQFWHDLRMRSLSRARFKCEACPNRRKLECHHVLYRRSWYDTQLDDLIVLCSRCHNTAHNSMTEVAFVRNESERNRLKVQLLQHLARVFTRVRSGYGESHAGMARLAKQRELAAERARAEQQRIREMREARKKARQNPLKSPIPFGGLQKHRDANNAQQNTAI